MRTYRKPVPHSFQKGMKTWITAAVSAAVFSLAAAPLTALAAGSVEMSTDYPGLTAKPGDTLSFDLDFDNASGGAESFSLSSASLPEGWKSYFEGGGNEISSVYVKSGANDNLATFNVEIPADAAKGSYSTSLHAAGSSGSSDDLTLTINISDEDLGSSKLETQYAEQAGTTGSDFSFSTTLQNNSPKQQSFSFTAEAPEGWTVTFKPAGQSTQVASVDVPARGSQAMTVSITPPQDVEAGDYTIPISAASAGETLQSSLKVTITGNYKLELATGDGVLSFDATANKKKAVDLKITNSGNSAIDNVNLSAEAPSGWDVVFSESTIDHLEAGASKDVTMYVTPGKDSMSGDYVMNVSAKNNDTTASAAFRVTVKTSTLWGIVSIALIAAILGGIAAVFRKFGRH